MLLCVAEAPEHPLVFTTLRDMDARELEETLCRLPSVDAVRVVLDGDRVTEALILDVGHVITCGESEIVVHSAHETETSGAGESGADLHADPTQRVSEDIRRLKLNTYRRIGAKLAEIDPPAAAE